MTAEERTEKLILEIAHARIDVDEARQFTSCDFRRYLATHGIEMTEEALDATLQSIVASGNLWSFPMADGERFAINLNGAARLVELGEMSIREEEASLTGPKDIALVCVSEKSLDRWWSSLCGEMKTNVFVSYFNSLDAEPVCE